MTTNILLSNKSISTIQSTSISSSSSEVTSTNSSIIIKRSKYHKLATFTPRLSAFDRRNQLLHQDPLRGLYALFWILLTFHVLATLQASGSFIIQSHLARLFTKHLPQLIILDLSMVTSTFSSILFAQLISKNYLRYCHAGQILQHVFQFLWLAFWITLIFITKWPWIQSGFLTLHSITMLMKMHSYCATNGEYAELSKILESKINQLRQLGIIKLSPIDTNKSNDYRLNGVIWNQIYENLNQVIDQKRRIQKKENITEMKTGEKVQDAPDLIENQVQETIDILHRLGKAPSNYKDRDNNDKAKCWPESLTVSNFIDYLLVPTLVYELSYPRTKQIRYAALFEKILEIAAIFGLLYMITQYYIWDHLSGISLTDQGAFPNVVDNVIKLMIPFTINYLLIFYIIFECICNAFAELTRFADREFYSDWWNSCSFDEFSRKWNKPVHHFLLKHVYASTIASYGFSRSAATLFTFLLSSLVHELLMVIVTRKFRFYLFFAQMAQIPLTSIGKSKFFRSRPRLANFLFWIGLLSGFPALAVCYILY